MPSLQWPLTALWIKSQTPCCRLQGPSPRPSAYGMWCPPTWLPPERQAPSHLWSLSFNSTSSENRPRPPYVLSFPVPTIILTTMFIYSKPFYHDLQLFCLLVFCLSAPLDSKFQEGLDHISIILTIISLSSLSIMLNI